MASQVPPHVSDHRVLKRRAVLREEGPVLRLRTNAIETQVLFREGADCLAPGGGVEQAGGCRANAFDGRELVVRGLVQQRSIGQAVPQQEREP